MDALDSFGEVLWYLAFIAPIISIALFWRLKQVNRLTRILFGASVGAFITLLLFWASIGIAFRNGMGS